MGNWLVYRANQGLSGTADLNLVAMEIAKGADTTNPAVEAVN